jgi:hypothetical protein
MNDAGEHLHTCASPRGFLATPQDTANYRRVWARDGVITGLGALATDDKALHDAFGRTLDTLAAYPGRAGQIPSNVSEDGKVSYGTTAGRVDATAWFIIGTCALGRITGDEQRVVTWKELLNGAAAALAAWELNDGGLVYVPRGGDWADEYFHSGYGLFVQCVRLWAAREHAAAGERLGWPETPALQHEAARVEQAVVKAFAGRTPLLCCFDPGREYAYFDAFGTALWAALGLPGCKALLSDAITRKVHGLVPAFDPPVRPGEPDYLLLEGAGGGGKMRNKPGAYHNGGLWPVVNGFVAVALRRCGDDVEADAIANRIAQANWEHGYPEFLHAETAAPGGILGLAWSAAAELMAREPGYGVTLFGEPGRGGH